MRKVTIAICALTSTWSPIAEAASDWSNPRALLIQCRRHYNGEWNFDRGGYKEGVQRFHTKAVRVLKFLQADDYPEKGYAEGECFVEWHR